MNRKLFVFVVILVAGMPVCVWADPSDESESKSGDQREERAEGSHRRRPSPPLLGALDANDDREISAEELAGAIEALKKLDKNEDGKLAADEIRPDFLPRPPHGGMGQRGGRGPHGLRPPPGFDRHYGGRDFERHAGRGGRHPDRRDFDRRHDRGDRHKDRGHRDDDHGRAERDDDDRRSERPDQRRGPAEGRAFPGRPAGPPNPEAFVERMMRFDENKDSSISKEELMKMVDQFRRRFQGLDEEENENEGKGE